MTTKLIVPQNKAIANPQSRAQMALDLLHEKHEPIQANYQPVAPDDQPPVFLAAEPKRRDWFAHTEAARLGLKRKGGG